MSIRIRVILGLLLALPLTPASHTLATPNHFQAPILLNFSDIKPALQKPIKWLSVSAMQDGVLQPIPYQIDEYNTEGTVFFDEADVTIDGVRDIADANDKLLFLLDDASERRDPTVITDGTVIAEIQVKSIDNKTRYVYLMEKARLPWETSYVRYSLEESRVETDHYTIQFDKDNYLIWNDFQYGSYSGKDPFDSLKLRFSTGLMGSGQILKMNNENFIAKPVAATKGPIRSTVHMEFTFWLMGMPLITATIQGHHYPQMTAYDIRLIMPEFRRSFLSHPEMTFSFDINGLLDAEIYRQGIKEVAIVDGVIGEEEKNMMATPYAHNNNWFYLKSKKGMDLMMFFDWLGDSNEPVSFYVQDSKTLHNPPERFLGQMPNIGYTVHDFPEKGFFGFAASLYLSDGFEGNPHFFAQDLRTSPEISVLY